MLAVHGAGALSVDARRGERPGSRLIEPTCVTKARVGSIRAFFMAAFRCGNARSYASVIPGKQHGIRYPALFLRASCSQRCSSRADTQRSLTSRGPQAISPGLDLDPRPCWRGLSGFSRLSRAPFWWSACRPAPRRHPSCCVQPGGELSRPLWPGWGRRHGRLHAQPGADERHRRRRRHDRCLPFAARPAFGRRMVERARQPSGT